VPKTTHRVVAGDRVQPRAESVGFTQVREVGCGNAEGVLHTVGRFVTVPDQPHAEVVEPIGVAVVNLGECLTITRSGRSGEFTVADIGPQLQCSGHRNPP